MITTRLLVNPRFPYLLKLSSKALANRSSLLSQCHDFSSVASQSPPALNSTLTPVSAGTVKKQLRALPQSVIETILQELHSVDSNSDGR